MKLLREITAIGKELQIGEAQTSTGGKAMFIEGPFVMCNQVNRNGRNYDLEKVGRPAVEAYDREYIQDRRAIGELKHPDYPFPDIEHAALKTESLVWQGNNAIGRARILNTPKGQIIRALADADFNLAVSTRGLGETVEVNGYDDVKPGFMLTAVDAVDRPSGQVCYVKAVHESVDWQLDESSGIWMPRDIKGQVVDNLVKHNSQLEDDFLRRLDLALKKLG
ncbi:head maturation protease [Klebsiella phage vB_KpnM_KpS110]|uniref:Prohead assembly (Scaffolding) protein n=6 Tax=Taipeivirus TaxID=2731621 RepID=A0A5Q2F2U7_9CAUD|nr:head maturation protease [Klebsiella phage Menlow]YP_009798915.1 head maturation protease [Klebsiella phage vB_KpnM_KpS110]YP_009822534.1 head maturation protease [Escherichia phage vB_EcoM_KWBSE43-6]YP_009883479.1 head maturation protease [Klebsiella phage Magnus]YP_009884751.1 head maturation protease [Klebsiella phage UPM 2146]UJD04751.1 prohead assembly (Scaffolding) protein [Klebsiella phage PWKp5]UPW36025.1 putative prohead protease [Klebsiella phage K751]URG13702.1 prohead protease